MRIFKKSTSISAIAGAVLASSTVVSFAGLEPGSNLGDCYNNAVNWCNQTTSGYPSSCYGNSLDWCDGQHSSNASPIPSSTVKAMKSSSLRKAKPARATTQPISVQPRKITN